MLTQNFWADACPIFWSPCFNVQSFWLTRKMGCCLPSISKVQEDPSVSAHVLAKDVLVLRKHYRRTVSGFNGVLYIQDGALHHQVLCGSKLCCGCCSMHFQLSNIKAVEMVQNETFTLPKTTLFFRPGLRITMEETTGPPTTMLVAIPEAVIFYPKLLSACGLMKDYEF